MRTWGQAVIYAAAAVPAQRCGQAAVTAAVPTQAATPGANRGLPGLDRGTGGVCELREVRGFCTAVQNPTLLLYHRLHGQRPNQPPWPLPVALFLPQNTAEGALSPWAGSAVPRNVTPCHQHHPLPPEMTKQPEHLSHSADHLGELLPGGWGPREQ